MQSTFSFIYCHSLGSWDLGFYLPNYPDFINQCDKKMLLKKENLQYFLCFYTIQLGISIAIRFLTLLI